MEWTGRAVLATEPHDTDSRLEQSLEVGAPEPLRRSGTVAQATRPLGHPSTGGDVDGASRVDRNIDIAELHQPRTGAA